MLDLHVQEMESLDAPGGWEWLAGVGVGVGLATAAVLIGLAIT
jgi:hypothetical protein